MIRFCVIDVNYELYEHLDRKRILEYFLEDNSNNIVCVNDSDGRFKGIITHKSLTGCNEIQDAVLQDHVALDEHIWLNAKYYFAHYKFEIREHVVLPVLDKKERLVCFAYEDADANREVRMLRELLETPSALQFTDIYPEYNCVKIYGFNELAFLFVKYLEKQQIKVQVDGEMWKRIYPEMIYQNFGDNCFNVFAEGVENRKIKNWLEKLLRSVSEEFECIDKIYEANVKNGIIKDCKGDINELLSFLKNESEIVLFGSGHDELNAYDFLVKNGVHIECFADPRVDEQSHKIFGKDVLSRLEARETYKNAVFIDCVSKFSSWGGGRIDYYDYIGYKRNERFFLLKDYIELQENNLLNLLKGKKVILAGDIYLCSCLDNYLTQNSIFTMGYLDVLEQIGEGGQTELTQICIKDINSVEVTCLLVLPEYFRPDHKQRMEEDKKKFINYLKENDINDYTEYFSCMSSFICIEKNNNVKYTKKQLIPKRVILGSIESCSGNEFFRGLLDWHPSILMIYYSNLNSKLFWICIRLAEVSAENILSQFWKIYEAEGKGNYAQRIHRPERFNKKMKQLLKCGESFTSQELFVIFHVSFMYMCGIDIKEENIKNMVIYWEPHHTTREILEECVMWLGCEKVNCDIINLVRDACKKNGSLLKGIILMNWAEDKTLARYMALSYRSIDKKKYDYNERIVVRFEDLKCNPRKILFDICDKWGIEWSDSLLTTTHNGEKNSYDNGEKVVKDFDLESVYNNYEQYFSEFDRFRIMIATAPWQRKYGYPYVEISQFSRRECQELFSKRFRFENMIKYNGSMSKLEVDIEVQNIIRVLLQNVRALEFRLIEKNKILE